MMRILERNGHYEGVLDHNGYSGATGGNTSGVMRGGAEINTVTCLLVPDLDLVFYGHHMLPPQVPHYSRF